MISTDTATQAVDLDQLAASIALLASSGRMPSPNYLSVGSTGTIGLSYYTLARAGFAAAAVGVSLGEPYKRSDGGWQAHCNATLATGQVVNIVGVADRRERVAIDDATRRQLAEVALGGTR